MSVAVECDSSPAEIRSYQPCDASAVVALWTRVFGYTEPQNEPGGALRRKLAIDDGLLFVAELGGEVVGTVMAGYDGHRGWIYSLAVSPESRRRGIGLALVRHVERELERRGCPKINLQILASNAATVAFYEKLGYSVEQRVSLGKTLV